MARKINVRGLMEILSLLFSILKILFCIVMIIFVFENFFPSILPYKTDIYSYSAEKCEIYSTKNEVYLVYTPNQETVVDSTGKVDVDNVNVTKFLLYANADSSLDLVYQSMTVKIHQISSRNVQVKLQSHSGFFVTESAYDCKVTVRLPEKLYKQTIKDLEKRQDEKLKKAITG